MQYNLPKRINSEQDLKHYENYLSVNTLPQTEIIENRSIEFFLKKYIGKFVRVEICGCNRKGVITETGKDFLVLRCSNNNTLIPLNQIKSIILPQGNQTHRHPQNFLP